jgi:hypothetical protein
MGYWMSRRFSRPDAYTACRNGVDSSDDNLANQGCVAYCKATEQMLEEGGGQVRGGSERAYRSKRRWVMGDDRDPVLSGRQAQLHVLLVIKKSHIFCDVRWAMSHGP